MNWDMLENKFGRDRSKGTEDEIDLLKLISSLLRRWHWYLITLVVALICAYLYIRWVPPQYKVDSLLMVRENEDTPLSLNNVFSGESLLNPGVNIDNYTGLLTSFHLALKAVRQLHWDYSWYRAMPLGDYDLLGKEPFELQLQGDSQNPVGIPVTITPLNDKQFRVAIKGKITDPINGHTHTVSIRQQGTFGETFRSRYFSFVLRRKPLLSDGPFYFVVNDPASLAKVFLKELQVGTTNHQSDLIRLSMTGQNQVRLILFLHQLLQVYGQYDLDETNRVADNTINFIDQRLKSVVDTLRLNSDELTRFRSEHHVYKLEDKAGMVVKNLSLLDDRESVARMQLDYYRNLLKYAGQAEKMKQLAVPSVVGITDVSLDKLVGKLIDLYSRRESMTLGYRDRNPAMIILNREIQVAQQDLKQLLSSLVHNTKLQLESIKREISAINQQLGSYPRTGQELIRLQRMYDLNNQVYTFMLQKRSEAEISRASAVSAIRVVDRPRAATSVQVSPRPLLIMVIAVFLAFLFPSALIVGFDLLDRRIHSRDDIRQLTAIPLMASLLHSHYPESVPVACWPQSMLAESFRDLRTNLSYMHTNPGSVVIGVDSALAGEGKSFVAVNLSAVLAMAGRKVLLIGADMRKPTLHASLKVDNQTGLSSWLIRKDPLEKVVRTTTIPNLSVLPSGPIPPNPAELLDSDLFGELIDEVRLFYDFILIDNSPMSLVSDGMTVKRHTDVDLFVVRQNFSKKEALKFLEEVTLENKMKKAAVVFNDCRIDGTWLQKRLKSKRYGGYYSEES